MVGLEPTTFGITTRCSDLMSYTHHAQVVLHPDPCETNPEGNLLRIPALGLKRRRRVSNPDGIAPQLFSRQRPVGRSSAYTSKSLPRSRVDQVLVSLRVK